MWGRNVPPTAGPPPLPQGPRFSRVELRHIAIAFSVLTFDLWLIFDGVSPYTAGSLFGHGLSPSTTVSLLLGVPVAALAAGTGFLAHEMGHKFAAQHLGLWAEFRAFWNGLIISVLFSALGFLFAAPGATYIAGRGDREENGLTSLAGPAVNLLEAAVLVGGGLALERVGALFVASVLLLVGSINVYWAAFNLIPFGPLDGAKVLRWKAPVWAAVFAGAVAWGVALFLFTGFL